MTESTKVFGLILGDRKQRSLIEKHCMGDCGKLSVAGCVNDAVIGVLAICAHSPCPWLHKETDKPWGSTMFYPSHDVYLRSLTDTPEQSKESSDD